jgi:hypothetical protein
MRSNVEVSIYGISFVFRNPDLEHFGFWIFVGFFGDAVG